MGAQAAQAFFPLKASNPNGSAIAQNPKNFRNSEMRERKIAQTPLGQGEVVGQRYVQ